MGFRCAMVLEHRPATDDLLLRAGIGWHDGVVGRVVLKAHMASPPGHSFRTGTPLAIENLPEQEQFEQPDLLRSHGIVALLTVPIQWNGFAYGVLGVGTDAPRRLDQDGTDFLLALANALATAIRHRGIEADLATSYHETREILESIDAGFYALDHEWRFTHVNRKAEELSGFERESLLGQVIWEAFPQVVSGEMRAAHIRAAVERRPIKLDAFSTVLGRWIGMTIYPNATGMSVYFRDITERRQTEAALCESEERFRSTFEQAAVGLSHIAPDGHWLRVNQRLCEITGYSRDELLSKSFQELTYREDLDADLANTERLLAGEISTSATEKRCIRKDGSRIWVRQTISLVRDQATGKPHYMISVVEDIDKRRSAECKLRESRERLRTALSASGMGTYRRELRSNRVDRDENLCRLYGLTPSQTVGDVAEWLQCIHPEDRATAAAAVDRCVRESGDLQVDYRVVWPDGSVHWLTERGKTVFNEAGKPLYVTGATIDITERKRVEESLQERDERLQAALHASSTAVYRWDIRSGAIFGDGSLERFYGLAPGEAVRDVHEDLRHVHPEDQAAVTAASERCVREGIDFDMDYRIIRADGTVLWVSDKGKLVRDREGKPLYVTGACTDITERKQVEEHRKLLMAELNHRVKNSLAVVQSIAAQTLRHTTSPEAFCASLTGRLQALATAHNLLTRNNWQSTNLTAVVSQVLDAHAKEDSRFEIHGSDLALSPKQTLTLSLVLHELATNAAKYGALSTAGGRVEVRWGIEETDNRRLRLTWVERGGPPVRKPTTYGFGTKLIEHSFAYDLAGSATLTFGRGGLECELVMPRDGGIGARMVGAVGIEPTTT
ncbi:PAS domain S-box protein [Virgifigura deserti]|uniref:PAS domain S-box protein n=1 Tax=Virgifigura deserti TaxID=2268457 RepID=UPI003CCBA6BB